MLGGIARNINVEEEMGNGLSKLYTGGDIYLYIYTRIFNTIFTIFTIFTILNMIV